MGLLGGIGAGTAALTAGAVGAAGYGGFKLHQSQGRSERNWLRENEGLEDDAIFRPEASFGPRAGITRAEAAKKGLKVPTVGELRKKHAGKLDQPEAGAFDTEKNIWNKITGMFSGEKKKKEYVHDDLSDVHGGFRPKISTDLSDVHGREGKIEKVLERGKEEAKSIWGQVTGMFSGEKIEEVITQTVDTTRGLVDEHLGPKTENRGMALAGPESSSVIKDMKNSLKGQVEEGKSLSLIHI